MSVGCRLAHCLAAVLGCAAVAAGAAVGDAAERERIVRERSAAQQRFEAAESACRDRFAVTDCVDAAKRERRDVLGRLRREEHVLDEAQRKQRAAERMELIRRKVSEEGRSTASTRRAPGADAPASAAPRAARAAPEEAAEGRPLLRRGQVTVRSKPAPATGADRAAQESRQRADFEARRRGAQEHLEANRQRNEERARSKPAAAPLPSGAASR